MDLQELLDLPVHLRDALWRFDAADVRLEPSAGLVVAGMGGSAIGGALARAVLGEREAKPIVCVRDYVLPAWVDESWTILFSSYSGSTEETLSCWDGAPAGAQRVVATTGGPLGERALDAGVPLVPLPGGFQPRAAVGYALGVALEVAAACGAGPALRGEIESASSALEGDDLQPRARELAEAIGDDLPLFLGGGLTAAVAYRWKTQVNENANRTAYWNELPEHDHNEIEGWGAPVAGVLLRDAQGHPRVDKRFEITARIAREAGSDVHDVLIEGQTRAERVVRGVALGDLVSFFMAEASGTDPAAIPALNALKSALAEAPHS
jgi:glucose/mannose-6-phosphate isomerase